MNNINLELLEISLKKRCNQPYRWLGNKQTDVLDSRTNFIYKTRSYQQLIENTASLTEIENNYALNRWYNFWSAMAIEQLFAAHNNVTPNTNAKSKSVDFTIDNIPFDHKSSVYPKSFGFPIEYAKRHKAELINWLYSNQSTEGRQHFKNRLFMIFYDGKNNDHWKLKSEINLIKTAIDNYVGQFNAENLFTFDFGEGQVLSDIIWVENLSNSS